jgi:hypothetical protein
MPHQNTPDQPPLPDCSFDGMIMNALWTLCVRSFVDSPVAILRFLDEQPCPRTPDLGDNYGISNFNLVDSPAPQPVTLNDTVAQNVDYPGKCIELLRDACLNLVNVDLSFSATNTPHERLQMLTPEAIEQTHPLSNNLGRHNVVAPHYSTPLFPGLLGMPHRHGTSADTSTPPYQQQQQTLPGGLPLGAVAPTTSPQLVPFPSQRPHQSQPPPPPRAATNSIRRHPLLANNFRELGQAKERDLLIQVLHSEWYAGNEEEPQDMGRSILMGFMHRKNPQTLLSCTFDGCTRSFDRQDRAVAHVRQFHLTHKPFACGGACGKGPWYVTNGTFHSTT